jgi:DNA-binding transcriptional LysR family regulator
MIDATGSGLDSEALGTFLTVHRRGGVSAAANALGRTQSAISRRLALLEEAVGTRLFERIGRRLVLSEAGAALLPHAERVMAALDDARAAVSATRAGRLGEVRIATVGTLADAALANVLRRVRAHHPTLDLRLETATSAEVSARVRAGDASIGLRYFADRSPDLACRVLRHERLVVACAPEHPFAGRRVPTLARLAGERWLAFPAPSRGTEVFAETVRAQFLARDIDAIDTVAIDSLTAQKRLVEAGFGIALLQAEAVAEERARGRLATIDVDDLDASVPVARIVRRAAHLGEGARLVLAALERD